MDGGRRIYLTGEAKGRGDGADMEESLLLSFHSTQQALRAELLLEYAGVDIDIRPTPKDITAGCAMSIAFPAGDLAKVRRIIAEERVEIDGIYCLRDGIHVRMEDPADGTGRGDEAWK